MVVMMEDSDGNGGGDGDAVNDGNGEDNRHFS